MNILDWLYRSIMNINVGTHKGDDFNPDRVVCTLDDREVDCFTSQLEADGYVYNDIRDWWERTWSTNEGKESIQEVYKLEGDNWKQLMIGYGDRVFYEENVNVVDGIAK